MGEGPALCMCTPGKASPTTALTESQNIPEQVENMYLVNQQLVEVPTHTPSSPVQGR